MNFTLRDLRKGKIEMEKSITKVGRIRRQFSGGRPPKPGSWDTRTALRTIAQRADAIRDEMKKAKLDVSDLTAILVVGQFMHSDNPLDTSRITALTTFEPFVIGGESHQAATIEKLLLDPSKVVIGTIFQVYDREMQPEPKFRRWATAAFRDADGEAEIALAAVLKRLEVTGKPGQPIQDYSA
jgi:hypothetical protein